MDGRRALEYLYGPLDPKLGAAVWAVKDVPADGPVADLLGDGDEVLVSVTLAAAVKEGDQERFYLGVTLVPKTDAGDEAFDCETCAPIVGATIFVKQQGRWVVEAHAPFIEQHGYNGHGPAMKLVSIGPARSGIMVTSDWFNRGSTGTFVNLWTEENRNIASRFGIQVAEENGGNCSDDSSQGLESCYEHSLDLRFQPGPMADRFDIKVTPNDPMWEYDDHGDHGEKLFRFDGKRYAVVAETNRGPEQTASPWTGTLPAGDPSELLAAYLRADARGMRLSSEHWPLVTQFTTWRDGPGWDTSAVVDSVEIVDRRDLGRRAQITVRVSKIGDLHADGDNMPVLDTTSAGVEIRKFVLQDFGKGGKPRWKIVEPQDGPHLAVDYVLSELLPAWCGTRDCSRTDAYRILRQHQVACRPSAIVINRGCQAPDKQLAQEKENQP